MRDFFNQIHYLSPQPIKETLEANPAFIWLYGRNILGESRDFLGSIFRAGVGVVKVVADKSKFAVQVFGDIPNVGGK